MRIALLSAAFLLSAIMLLAGAASANDWPQWRGPNRDGKASGFKSPDAWPKELKQKWKITIGDGVATPALVGDRLYVYARRDRDEIIRCLDAATGKELWQDKHEAESPRGGAAGFPGPRSSPTVADGKVVTLGVQGTLSCYDAATGKLLWRKTDFERAVPMFAAASSPIVVDGLCIAHLGKERDGAIIAFDLTTGEEKWKWTGDGPAYGSPVLVSVEGAKAIVAPTSKNMVALAAADGKLLWKIMYSQGRYNAATPIVDGQTLLYAGPTKGITAEKIVKQGDELATEDVWANGDNSVQFNTPVLKDGLVFGISNVNSLFCIDAKEGKTLWNAPLGAMPPGGPPPAERPEAERERRPEPGGRDRRGFGRRGGGRGGYGSVVDAGSVLLALIPSGELTVFTPGKEFKELAKYKVAEGSTYAHPIASGNRIFIKDKDSIVLWTVP